MRRGPEEREREGERVKRERTNERKRERVGERKNYVRKNVIKSIIV